MTDCPAERTHVGYRFWASEEQPEGVAESGLLVADSEEDAQELLREEVGTHVDWQLAVESSPTYWVPKGIIHVEKAQKRSPMMCANDLYAMDPTGPPPTKTTTPTNCAWRRSTPT